MLSIPCAGEYLALGGLPLGALPASLLVALLLSLLGLELVLFAALALGDDLYLLNSLLLSFLLSLLPLLGFLCLLNGAWLGSDALKLITSARRGFAVAV